MKLIKFKFNIRYLLFVIRYSLFATPFHIIHTSIHKHTHLFYILMITQIIMIKRWERDHIISIETMFVECIITSYGTQTHMFVSTFIHINKNIFLSLMCACCMLRLIKQFSELFTISSNERNFYALQALYNSLSSIHLFFLFFYSIVFTEMHIWLCECLFPSLRFQTNCKTYLTFQFDDSKISAEWSDCMHLSINISIWFRYSWWRSMWEMNIFMSFSF